MRQPGTEIPYSPIEELFWMTHLRLRLPNLQGLVREHEVFDGQYRLDFAMPGHKLGVELDGWAYHGDRESFLYDRRRDRQLSMSRWVVIHFTGSEVLDDVSRCVREANAWAGVWRRERSRE